MKQRPAVMCKANMIGATQRAQQRVLAVLEQAAAMGMDKKKDERLAKHECCACFYSSRMAGQAMTERECMSCNEVQIYGSTSTDVLCMACAQAGKLCKHCGGDLELRSGRRQWPEPKVPV